MHAYEEALELTRRVRFRPELALIRLDLGELLLRHYPRERSQGVEHLKSASKSSEIWACCRPSAAPQSCLDEVTPREKQAGLPRASAKWRISSPMG